MIETKVTYLAKTSRYILELLDRDSQPFESRCIELKRHWIHSFQSNFLSKVRLMLFQDYTPLTNTRNTVTECPQTRK